MYSLLGYLVVGIILIGFGILGLHRYFQRYKWFVTELSIYNERKIRVTESILRLVYWRRNKNLFGMTVTVVFIGIGLWLINEWLFGLGIFFLIYLTK